MAYDPKHLQVIFQRAAPPELEVRFKPMFGGILAYVFDKPCGALFDGGLGLKFPGAAARAEMLALPGARPLRYAPDQPSKTYVMVPNALLDDPRALGVWIARSAAEIKGGKAPPPRKRRKG